MPKIYACLLGQWVCLNDDENSLIFDKPLSVWIDEGHIHSPNYKEENSLYDYDHLLVTYKNNHYRIHPAFIQITNKTI